MTKRFVFACIIGLGLATGGCAPEEGDDCDMPDECGSELVCAEIVVCAADAEHCPGICYYPCTTDDDCEGDHYCGDTAGGQRVCLASRILGSP